MDENELPTLDAWNAYDWSEVLGRNAEHAAKMGADGPVDAGRIKHVVWIWAESPEGYGSVDMACLAELTDGTYAMCEAWADTTGWGCRDGVTWKIGDDLNAAIAELSEANRARYREQEAA